MIDLFQNGRAAYLRDLYTRNKDLRSPNNIVEVGSWKGDFAKQLHSKFPKSKLYLIDPWRVSEENAQAWYGSQRITQKEMDQIYESVKERFFKISAISIFRGDFKEFANNGQRFIADLVYIDGDHRYEGCLEDLQVAHRITATGSVINLDDYLSFGWWGDGVIRALNDFLGSHPREYEVIAKYGHQIAIQRVIAKAT